MPKGIAVTAAGRACAKISAFFADVNSGLGLLPTHALINQLIKK